MKPNLMDKHFSLFFIVRIIFFYFNGLFFLFFLFCKLDIAKRR